MVGVIGSLGVDRKGFSRWIPLHILSRGGGYWWADLKHRLIRWKCRTPAAYCGGWFASSVQKRMSMSSVAGIGWNWNRVQKAKYCLWAVVYIWLSDYVHQKYRSLALQVGQSHGDRRQPVQHLGGYCARNRIGLRNRGEELFLDRTNQQTTTPVGLG